MSSTKPHGQGFFYSKPLNFSVSRPTKSLWHGGGGMSWDRATGQHAQHANQPQPGTCNEWRSYFVHAEDLTKNILIANIFRSSSELAVGFASKLSLEGTDSLLTPYREPCNKQLLLLCVESTSPDRQVSSNQVPDKPGLTYTDCHLPGLWGLCLQTEEGYTAGVSPVSQQIYGWGDAFKGE